MFRRLVLACIFGTTLVVAGCGTVRKAEEAVANVEQGSAQTAAFPLDDARARQVIREAIREGWPDEEPQPLDGGRVGYQFQLRFLIDREQIIVEAVPSGGGLAFRVTNRGTAPAVGVPARDKLIGLLEKRARN